MNMLYENFACKSIKSTVAAFVAIAVLGGCAGRPALIPNSDAALRKTSTQFAADAASRTYPADAPSGSEAVARAEVDYTLKQIRLANLSGEDWKDVEVWVNGKYVVYLPTLPKANKAEGYRHLNFQLLFDKQGNSFPVSVFKSNIRVEKVEVFHDGKLFGVPVHLVD